MANMKVSLQGRIEIMAHEGVVLSRYKDSVGVWTIGVGVTDAAEASIKPSTFKGSITTQQAVEMFERVLQKYEGRVNKAITAPLEQHEFDALVSFDYNTGGIFESNTRKLINAGKIEEGGNAMMGWTRPPEIAERRAKEVSLFLTGKYGNGVVSVYPATASGAVQWSKGKRVNLSGMLSNSAPTPAPRQVPVIPKDTKAVVLDAAAPNRVSKEKLVSGLGGVAVATGAAKEIADNVSQTAMSLGDFLLPATLAVAAGALGFVWYRRDRRQRRALAALKRDANLEGIAP